MHLFHHSNGHWKYKFHNCKVKSPKRIVVNIFHNKTSNGMDQILGLYVNKRAIKCLYIYFSHILEYKSVWEICRFWWNIAIQMESWQMENWNNRFSTVSFLIDPQCQFPGEGQNMKHT